MGSRVWKGAIAGVVAAVIAWVVSYPFLPVKYIDISDPKSLEQPIESHFTLGTFYGWFSHGLFGLLATLFIVVVYTSKMPFRKRILPCLIVCGLGALWVAGGDALSDSFCIWIGHQNWDVAIAGLLAAPVVWALIMSIALCSAIVVSMAIRADLIGRLFLAIGISTATAIVLRMAVGSISQVIVFGLLMNSSGKVNSWAMGAPGFLASFIALGAASGASLAIADIVARKAWIRLSLGAKEGYTWSVDRPMTIGTGELADIRVPRDGGGLPKHAQIDLRGSQYFIRHLGGQVPTYVNNTPIQSVELNDGDIIRVGYADLVFHVRNQQTHGRLAPSPAAQTSAWEPLAYHLIDPLGNTHAIQTGKMTIGRDAGCTMPMAWEPSLSAYHAEVSLLVDDLTIRDLGSTNGTRVNGNRIGTAPVPIKAGDVLELGAVKLRVQSNRPLL